MDSVDEGAGSEVDASTATEASEGSADSAGASREGAEVVFDWR